MLLCRCNVLYADDPGDREEAVDIHMFMDGTPLMVEISSAVGWNKLHRMDACSAERRGT